MIKSHYLSCPSLQAAAPRNNLIRRAAELVGLNVEKERNGYPFPPAYDTDLQILYRTGPGVFTDATLDHIAQFNYRGYDIGQGDVRMGDVYILNLNAFRTELVYHHFFGSWKSEETTNRETEVVGTFGGGAAVDGISHDDKGVASTPDT